MTLATRKLCIWFSPSKFYEFFLANTGILRNFFWEKLIQANPSCQLRPSLMLHLQPNFPSVPIFSSGLTFFIFFWNTVTRFFPSTSHSGAWALEKSLTRPSYFLYFPEKSGKNEATDLSDLPVSQLRGSTIAILDDNLCSCARPAHVGKCWPGSLTKSKKKN